MILFLELDLNVLSMVLSMMMVDAGDLFLTLWQKLFGPNILFVLWRGTCLVLFLQKLIGWIILVVWLLFVVILKHSFWTMKVIVILRSLMLSIPCHQLLVRSNLKRRVLSWSNKMLSVLCRIFVAMADFGMYWNK